MNENARLLMLLAVLSCIAIAYSCRDDEKPSRSVSDQEAEPDNTNYVPFIGSFHAPDMALAGFWEKRQEMDVCTLNIQHTETGFAIEFFTRGCIGDWKLSRTGKISDGILSINRPVMEYVPRRYDRFYPVRVDGHDYLISQASSRHLHERSLLDPENDLGTGIKRNSFERKTK